MKIHDFLFDNNRICLAGAQFSYLYPEFEAHVVLNLFFFYTRPVFNIFV